MRVNLITNGFLSAEADLWRLVRRRARLRPGERRGAHRRGPRCHHRHPGLLRADRAGHPQLPRPGIHVHTNTTICPENRDWRPGHGGYRAPTSSGTSTFSMTWSFGPAGPGRGGRAAGLFADRVGRYADHRRPASVAGAWSGIPGALLPVQPGAGGVGSNSCAARWAALHRPGRAGPACSSFRDRRRQPAD